MNIIFNIFLYGPPLLIAVILHEIAHGYAAEKLGDPTAKREGRITLNPIKHIDPFMTILVPAILIFSGSSIIFGGAKPVPINPLYFKDPRRGMMYVALAGPVTNFILAFLCYIPFAVGVLHPLVFVSEITREPTFIGTWLIIGLMINLVLGIFNLIPIPPLDGGRIAVGLLPDSLAKPLAKLEPIGIIIVVVLLFAGFLRLVLEPIISAVLKIVLENPAAASGSL